MYIILQAKNEKQEVVYEKVSFGEVCHAPPSLQARSKGNAGAARVSAGWARVGLPTGCHTIPYS